MSASIAPAGLSAPALNPRTRMLLEGAIVPTLLRLAWPNILIMLTRFRWPYFADILRVGAVGSLSTLQTTLTVMLTTALVGAAAGPDAIAGYGTGGRLEYLLVPVVFGLGAPLVALVGTNIGAGNRQRALRIALSGGTIAFVLTEAIGITAALWPYAWLGLFGNDPRMLETGAAYLRVVGPAYGFFGLGLSLYFASRGRGGCCGRWSRAGCAWWSRSAAAGSRCGSLERWTGSLPPWRWLWSCTAPCWRRRSGPACGSARSPRRRLPGHELALRRGVSASGFGQFPFAIGG